jgi:hypothetical protein
MTSASAGETGPPNSAGDGGDKPRRDADVDAKADAKAKTDAKTDAKAVPSKKPERVAKVAGALVRRAVIIGVIVGGLLGVGIAALVLNIIGCRRDAARERENQKMLDDWNAEQERKRAEGRP